MNYRAALDRVLTGPLPLAEAAPPDKQRAYVKMVIDGKLALRQIMQGVPAGQRAIVATHIIKTILAKTAPTGKRWTARPRWAPMREDILSEETRRQKIDRIANYIAAGLTGLNRLGAIDMDTTKRILTQMVKDVKGNMQFAMNRPENMANTIKHYVDTAVRQNKGFLRFNAQGMSDTTKNSILQQYNQALTTHGLVGKWQPQKDGSMIMDFRPAAQLQKLADAGVKAAQRQGPSPHGTLSIPVGTVAQRLVAKGQISGNEAQQTFNHRLSQLGVNPAQVRLTADEPPRTPPDDDWGEGLGMDEPPAPVSPRIKSRLTTSDLAPGSHADAPMAHTYQRPTTQRPPTRHYRGGLPPVRLGQPSPHAGGQARVGPSGDPIADIHGQPVRPGEFDLDTDDDDMWPASPEARPPGEPNPQDVKRWRDWPPPGHEPPAPTKRRRPWYRRMFGLEELDRITDFRPIF